MKWKKFLKSFNNRSKIQKLSKINEKNFPLQNIAIVKDLTLQRKVSLAKDWILTDFHLDIIIHIFLWREIRNRVIDQGLSWILLSQSLTRPIGPKRGHVLWPEMTDFFKIKWFTSLQGHLKGRFTNHINIKYHIMLKSYYK